MKNAFFVAVLALALCPFSSKAQEAVSAVSVYAYVDGVSDANQLFVIALAAGTKEAAEAEAKSQCERVAGSSGPKCRLIGTCDDPGLFAVASAIKSMGKAAMVCGKSPNGNTIEERQNIVLAEAKTACGGPVCARIKVGEIKAKPLPKKKKKNI